MNRLEALLARERVTVLDGGMGSTVEDRGVDVRNALWGSVTLLTEEGRALNDRAHADFVAAGAEVLIANTHNASLWSCAQYLRDTGGDARDRERLMETLNRAAIESARRAASSAGALREVAAARHVDGSAGVLGDVAATGSAERSADAACELVVAGCLGSAEGAYATKSRLTPEQVASRLGPQARVLAALAIDLLIFETLSTASELAGVASLARALGVPFAVGISVGESGHTHAGVSLAEAARFFAASPPAIWFIQCTRYDLVARALEALRAATGQDAVLAAYANDGRAWRDRRWHGARIFPDDYARIATSWRALGARVIGGCCGTGPEHIAALSRQLSAQL